MAQYKIEKLISILLDKNIGESDRDDVAMLLGESNDNEALNALLDVAKDEQESYILSASTGESIGSILVRRDKLNIRYLRILNKVALSEALAVIKEEKPDWYRKYHLSELNVK